MAPKDPPEPIKIKERNKDKKDDPSGWCTDDLYFDEVGRLFVPNAALAAEIQRTYTIWGKRFCIIRNKTAKEKEDEGGGGGIGENKVNTMCSCTGP